MRALIWIIGIPVGIVVIALMIIPLILDEDKLVAIAAQQIEAQTGGKLTVDGDASISLFPRASLSTSGVTLDLPDDGTRLEAGTLQAGVALFPILGGTVEIDSILVDSLTLTTTANPEEAEAAKVAALDTSTLSDAELDAFYAARAQARVSAQAQAAGAVVITPMTLEVGELTLRDIRVITVDDGGEPISELQLKHFTATDVNTAGRAVPLSAHVVVPDDESTIELVLAGELVTDLDAEELSLNSLDVTVTGATPEPIEFSTSGTFDPRTMIADLKLSLETGTLQGDGTVRYAALESPQIDATLALTELNPALLVLAGPEAVEAAEDEGTVAEPGADIPLPLHTLRMIDTRAALTIDKLILEGHELTEVDVRLRVVDGVATLKSGEAKVHNGTAAFETELDGRYNVATLRAEGGVNALDIASAVAAMDAGLSARGTANLTWNLSGEGTTVNSLTDSLKGPISFTTEDIVVEGVAAEQMLCKGVALVNQEKLSEESEFPVDTAFDALSAEIQLAEGVAKLNPLTAQLAGVTLSGNGELAINAGDLRASFRAQLSEALGELDSACRINERYAELRWPVECEGNLADDPAGWCGVNTSEIIRDLAEGEIKRNVEKEAGRLLKKLFD